jgi:rod shape-determining protein MreC
MGIAIVLLACSGIGLLRPVEDVSYTLLSPIEEGLRGIAQPFADIVSRYGDTHDLTQENEVLRAENERLTAEIARLHEDAARLDELERLLGTRDALAGHEFVAATIVSTDPTSGRRRVAIDLGRSDGLRVGMPVVTEGSTLVGTITKVEDDHAWVTLVTEIDSAVSAHVLESRAQGVVAGTYSGPMSMEFVDQNAAVKEGDRVVTSGLGGTYPEGLVVGRVTRVGGNPQELFRSVTVTPLASLSKLESVLVMVSFQPTELTAP